MISGYRVATTSLLRSGLVLSGLVLSGLIVILPLCVKGETTLSQNTLSQSTISQDASQGGSASRSHTPKPNMTTPFSPVDSSSLAFGHYCAASLSEGKIKTTQCHVYFFNASDSKVYCFETEERKSKFLETLLRNLKSAHDNYDKKRQAGEL